jgi:hypothetical protein
VTLVTVDEVKERAALIAGLSLPAGATDARILSMVTENQSIVLGAFGVETEASLDSQRQDVAKSAIKRMSVADLLVALFPGSDAHLTYAERQHKLALQHVDRTIKGASGAGAPSTGGGGRLSSGLM